MFASIFITIIYLSTIQLIKNDYKSILQNVSKAGLVVSYVFSKLIGNGIGWFAISAQTVKHWDKYHWKCGSVTIWLGVRNFVKPWLAITFVSLKCVCSGLIYLWNYLMCKVGVIIHPNDHTLVGIENYAQQQNFRDQAILIWKELRWKKIRVFSFSCKWIMCLLLWMKLIFTAPKIIDIKSLIERGLVTCIHESINWVIIGLDYSSSHIQPQAII